ncbi:MAG: ABC transporter substrate-binding protein [Alphaproteobacteria bacterium]
MTFGRVVLFLAMMLLLAGAATAPVAPPVYAAQPSGQEASSFVKSLTDRAINTVGAPSLSDAEREERFRQLFLSNFDIEYIARFVLGRHWRKASVQEQKDFVKLFEDITVLNWASRFKDYQGQTLNVTGVKPAPDDEVFVDSTVNQKDGPPVMVAWRLKQGDRGLRVVDLVVEGVSMSITYRSEYSAVLQRSGGDIGGLIGALRTKVGEIRGGAAGK